MKTPSHLTRAATIGMRHMQRSFLVIAALIGFAASATAQNASTVTLTYDDGEGISGELVEVNDQIVVLKSSIGLVTIPVEGVTCIGSACPDSMRFVSSAPLLTFTTLDGSVEVQGQLIEIANNQYVIATNLGELRFNIDGAICTGEGCPSTGAQPEFGGEVVLTSGATTIEGTLIGVEGTSYIVDVATMGTVRIDAKVFDCAGASCP